MTNMLFHTPKMELIYYKFETRKCLAEQPPATDEMGFKRRDYENKTTLYDMFE